MVAEPGFDVARFVESPLEELLDARLSGRPLQGGEERIPFGDDLRVGRQAVHVDQPLRLSEGLFVERRDSRGERVDEVVQFRVGEGPVDVPVALGEVAVDIVGAQQDFQRTAAPDQPRQPRHRAAAGDQARAHLPLRQQRLLPAGESHIAGEGELAADAGGTPADRGDRHDGCAAQPRQHVG